MQKYFSVLILLLTISFLTASNGNVEKDPPKKKKQFVVMIDPGHGGGDTGTPGTGRYKTTEKDVALDVSLALGKMLEKIPNVKVVYTRTRDTYPTLQQRAIVTNKKKADLFISIHCNAQPGRNGKKFGTTAYGSETFVLGLSKNKANLEVAKRENSVILLEDNYEETYGGFDPNSPESLISLILMQEEYLDQSIEIASYIQKEFKVTAKRKDRGVKQAGFWVLSKTYMPSVLVELGFLTHKKEEDFLNSKKGKKIMTQSLYNAIKKYISLHADTSSEIVINHEEQVTPRVYNGVTFKVQLSASSKKIPTKSYNFKGLKEISREKAGSIYRYFYGKTSDYEEIKRKKQEAIRKGYSDCYVVAYKKGKKVSLTEVLKQ
ncbi:N-acetylmuramoyl-L-alanine amidase [Kordia sp. YSTF-M3]|uniref:N-acetylmuramoyl-L-alanine amidase n=1 Tax=Kordia aestuariivivens TaxID=2759037 RepID=A0ABR7QD11_9FLAO|nr:N-acetylmuramoyl-L-alanine amidase [Kordia aestuariivivens]MBC8756444.1 N-acetylmuramoyl-L-alanine amidase [Kordia aestuariivivens]